MRIIIIRCDYVQFLYYIIVIISSEMYGQFEIPNCYVNEPNKNKNLQL